MKTSTATALLLAVAALYASAASFEAGEWSWRASVEVPDHAGRFVELDIEPRVFDISRPDLADLRLTGEGNVLVPHIVVGLHNAGAGPRDWVAPAVLNRAHEPGAYSRVTLDFGHPARKDMLRLELSGENYRRRAQVEGSVDGSDWDLLVESAWLFDVSMPGKRFAVNTVNLPVNDFRWLRLTVYNMPDDPGRIEIGTVEAPTGAAEALGPRVAMPVRDISRTRKEENTETFLELDLGVRNLPVRCITLAASDPWFHRAVEVSGRNAETESVRRRTETGWDEREQEAPWRHVTSGLLYRISGGAGVSERLAIDGIHAPYRHIRIRIFDGDAPPLRISADAVRVERGLVRLVFAPPEKGPLFLYGGNAAALPPRYDLAASVPNLPGQSYPSARLGQVVSIGEETGVPWTERNPYVVFLVLVVAVALTAGLILMSARRHREGQGGAD